jgi:hypothetical protein
MFLCGNGLNWNSIKSKPIHILVGKGEQSLFVHRNLIAASSAFFRKMLDGGSKEKDCVVRLPTQDFETVSTYVQWLYVGKIFSSKCGDIYPDNKGTQEWGRLLKLAILGDTIQDRQFRNGVIDALIDVVVERGKYPASLVARAFEKLPPQSLFRRLLIDFWIWMPSRSEEAWTTWFRNEAPPPDVVDGPTKFWLEVAKGSSKLALNGVKEDAKLPWIANRCQYHEHVEDEPLALNGVKEGAKLPRILDRCQYRERDEDEEECI